MASKCQIDATSLKKLQLVISYYTVIMYINMNYEHTRVIIWYVSHPLSCYNIILWSVAEGVIRLRCV